MKNLVVFVVLTGLITTSVSSQPPRNDRDGGPPGPPPRDPYLLLFDTNQDDEISQNEIENATQILKKLDRDRNGKITRDELPRPPRPGDDRPRPRDHRERKTSALENAPKGTVVFRGGYETDSRDRGRPVALIAAALDVKPEVFRKAFSNVKPARGGDPTEARAQANKKVLMAALGKHGISNDRLDAVSNYYRYQPGNGEIWKRTPATAKAIIKKGKVTGIKITNPGSGYTTPPTVSIAGYRDISVKATLAFSKNFRTNGSVKSLKIVK